ncbi:LamG domain-containing protein [Ekhidna sp.]|jgi:hypothetical protein|uniref:LamG domain-containing protein n=1 Tax=Ekhidna sp. TaxID=2608089 RepID=UPI0032EEE0B7
MKYLFLNALLFVSIFPVVSQDIDTGLEGHWAFNGNADDAVGQNHGTVMQATLTENREGTSDMAYYFDGASFISLQSPHVYSFGNTMSLFAWIRAEQFYENKFAVNFFEGTTYSKVGIFVSELNGRIARMGMRDVNQSGKFNNSTTPMTDTQWHHVGFTYDGFVIRIYVDGIIEREINETFEITDFIGQANIGRHPNASNYFVGAIDDIRLYSRALTQGDVTLLYNTIDEVNDDTDSGDGSTTISSLWQSSGQDIYYDQGNVGVGTDSPEEKLTVNGHISTTKTSNTKFQFVRHSHSGSHGILFNSYYNSTVSGNLSATGNTFYANNVGNHSGGAGAIMFYGNGGTIDFNISPSSPGADQPINWGDPKMRIKRNGNVGIGTRDPDAKLTVKGKIHAEEVKIDLSVPGPDYVFEPDYDLKSLEETEAYIQAYKHLPEIPSAKEMETIGVELGNMNMLLLKKIEELTLHTIQQQKLIERVLTQNEELKKKVSNLERSN